MKSRFHNNSGLNAFALACGYVQVVQGDGYERVDLFMQHGCYHVRAFNAKGDRLEWVSEGRLGDARHHWKKWIKQIFGDRIKEVKRCKRYEICHVMVNGDAMFQVVYNFDGEIRHVGYGDNEAAAWMIAHCDYVNL